MQGTQELIPKIHIGNENIYIHKSVIRVLGSPAYITLLQNEAQQTLVIIPCEASHTMAFKVPEGYSDTTKRTTFRIWSKEFIHDLRERYCMEDSETYTLSGIYVEKHNAVVFRFQQYRSHGFVVYNSI